MNLARLSDCCASAPAAAEAAERGCRRQAELEETAGWKNLPPGGGNRPAVRRRHAEEKTFSVFLISFKIKNM